MLEDREKISIRQAGLLLLTIVFSPAIRYFPTFAAQQARQAGWLAPLASFVPFAVLILIMQRIYINNYAKASFMDIIYDVLGKILGKLIVIVYIIYFMTLLALYTRYFVERLTSVIFPHTDMRFFIIVMILFIIWVLHYGIVPVARMNEIIFFVLLIVFSISSIFLIFNVKIGNITPLSYLDIIPIFKGSIGISAIWSYFFLIFMFSDNINNKGSIRKAGFQVAIFLLITDTLILITTIGTMGASVIERLPIPYVTAVKEISIFNTLEKIESIVVIAWIASDFIIITVFAYTVLHMIKSLFNLSNEKFLIEIVMIFVYFLSLYIAKSKYELEAFSAIAFPPMSIFLQFGIPILILVVGKIRKKII